MYAKKNIYFTASLQKQNIKLPLLGIIYLALTIYVCTNYGEF
jgi:hypothetical protein